MTQVKLVVTLVEDIFDPPTLVRTALRPLVAQLMELRSQIKSIEKELLA